MKIPMTLVHAIIVGSVAGVLGCAATTPTTTAQAPAVLAPFTATTDNWLPPPKLEGRRSLQADLETLDVASFDDMIGELPASISMADASKLLVTIDQSQVSSGASYSVLANGGRGGKGGGHSSGRSGNGNGHSHGNSHGHGHGHDNGHFDNFSDFCCGWGGFFPYAWYPYANYYFPYAAVGGAYAPYTVGGTLPFLYGQGTQLSPYGYSGTTLPWAGGGVTGLQPQTLGQPQVIGQPQAIAQPQTMAQPQAIGQPQAAGQPQVIGQATYYGQLPGINRQQPVTQLPAPAVAPVATLATPTPMPVAP